ncbi:hypothetical protein Q5P01_001972 [Channa striata]|uniref:C2H2-type domain-containing protein n=1 Tax=Channa striata TaxID=64152 RepID=A0AA88NQE7_CHASR|nr:hypothetical protein Q5P01_001972 [Channa striata]
MDPVPQLNAFIVERLSAAAVEIFGAVEKTLLDYQREIRQSKLELSHLRSLVLWPRVTLYRSVAHHLSPHSCDEKVSPECTLCYEEDKAPDVSTKQQVTLQVKEDHDHTTDRLGPSCRPQRDATTSQTTRRCDRKGLPSQLYGNADHRSDIKAEPAGDEIVASPSNREANIHCGINAGSCGHQQEILQDPDEQELSDEQLYPDQDWSPCQDLDPHQIKVESFPSSSPEEEYKLPLQSESTACDEPHSSSPSHNHTLSNPAFSTAERKKRDAEGEGCKLSNYSVNPDCCALLHSEYVENTKSVVSGESAKVPTLKSLRIKKRKNSKLCSKERKSVPLKEDVNDMTRERRHTCPICAKRFKESSHLKEHMRIHTGEKPYQCKQCGMNFRQSGALTLHIRIHTGERPFQCTDCGRRFNRKGDMETHRVTHTGERPHPCTVCGKSFRSKSNLNTHLKIHADGKNNHSKRL